MFRSCGPAIGPKEAPIALLIDVTLLSLLVLTALAVVWLKDLFAVVMLTGIYGLLSASFFVAMDAVDVAFTEAAVGAGISPILMLTALTMTERGEQDRPRKPWLGFGLVVITGSLLILGTEDLPPFGSIDAPAHQHVAPRYLEQSGEEIGIPNVVTSVLASYRAFDTLGEVVVIFTAGIGVLSLLMVLPAARARDVAERLASMHEQKILRVVGKIVIPPIMLFALYVQFHGDYGPGGGFQAGVIFAVAIILYSMLFGLSTARRVVSQPVIQMLAAVGVLVYGTVGVLGLLSGNHFLDYNNLAGTPKDGQHLGIILIELGVGITVAAVMITLFFSFAGRVGNGGRA